MGDHPLIPEEQARPGRSKGYPFLKLLVDEENVYNPLLKSPLSPVAAA